MRIAASDINEALTPIDSSNRNYILDRTATEIIGTGESKASSKIDAAVAKRLESEPDVKQGLINMHIDGEDAAVIYRSSGYNGWTYLTVVSIGELKKESRQIVD